MKFGLKIEFFQININFLKIYLLEKNLREFTFSKYF